MEEGFQDSENTGGGRSLSYSTISHRPVSHCICICIFFVGISALIFVGGFVILMTNK
mgnify:CR=1 FL=1